MGEPERVGSRLPGARARRWRSRDRQRRYRRSRVVAAITSVTAAVALAVTMRLVGPSGAATTGGNGSTTGNGPVFQGLPADGGSAAVPGASEDIPPARPAPHTSSRGS